MNYPIVLTLSLMAFLLLGKVFPLRISRENFKQRIFNNLTLFLIGVGSSKIISLPLILWFTTISAKKNIGIFHLVGINQYVEVLLSFIILDYTLYWWHRANHKVRFFWRFHQVHHSDKDMDTLTALRFHFGELILSAGFKSIVIIIFGLNFGVVVVFDFLVSFCSYFQHSNIKLPIKLENYLSKMIVSPRYHQNHHSYYLSETDSNYTTILNWWDKIHKSQSAFQRADEIIIGHPAFENSKITFIDLLKMPFNSIAKWPKHLLERL